MFYLNQKNWIRAMTHLETKVALIFSGLFRGLWFLEAIFEVSVV